MDPIKIRAPKECCQSRDILWYLLFMGFAVNFMLRINLNLAIVSMVRPKLQNNATVSSDCFVDSFPSNNSMNGSTKKYHFDNNTLPQLNITAMSTEKYFDWDEKELGNILGSFFWLQWISQIPGGILASKYGTKIVFGLSNFIGVIINCFIPWFAHKGVSYLIFLRCVQGLMCGFALPSTHSLVSKWIPPNERSKFITATTGNSVGAALTYFFSGFIIQAYGWESVFYTSGILGTVWCLLWWYLAYDSPDKHPRVSREEKDYILASLGKTISKVKLPTPWRSILTHVPFWASLIAQIGSNWGLFTITVNGPSYIKFVHGWDIRLTGVLSGMPHLFRTIFAYVFSIFADYLLRTEKISRSNVRKFAIICANGVQGMFMLGLAYSGCNKIIAITMLTLSVTVNGAVSSGALSGLVDITPNYSSILLGIVGTAVGLVGFSTPAVVGYITFQNETVVQWQKVFWLSAAILCLSCLIYIVFGNSKLASWNQSKDISKDPETEMMVFTKKDNMTKHINGKEVMEKN